MCVKSLENKYNIRKTTTLAKQKAKQKYKMLTELAIDSNYNDSQEIRQKEDQEFKKFMFYAKLEKAIDKIGGKNEKRTND